MRGAARKRIQPDALRSRRRPAAPWAFIVVYSILALAWAITNPPFSAPDESQHYLRAVGLSAGHLIGAPAVYDGPVLSPKETAWRHRLTRAVSVPAGLSPIGFECELFHPNVTPACSDHVTLNTTALTEQTDVGVYQPEPYLLPAVAVRLASHPASADRAGRLAMLILWVVLLSVAIWALWDAALGSLSLIGLVVAVTPMVVFMGASLTDSSLEIIASIAFFASLLRLARGPKQVRSASLLTAGAAGAVLSLSRSLGPLWVLIDLLLIWVLMGSAAIRALARRLPRPAAVGAAIVLAGIALNALWVHAYGPHPSVTFVPSFSALHDGLSQLRSAWDGVIGVFGYEDVPLGRFGVVTWTVMGLLLLGRAAWSATRRERGALLAAMAFAFVLPIYIYAAITSAEGIQTQGRHILPLIVTVPLLSGELIRRHAAELREPIARLLLPVTCIVAAGLQLLAWWENSRRYAVGLHGTWWFLSRARWSPPGGWVVWSILLSATALAVLVCAAASLNRRWRPS